MTPEQTQQLKGIDGKFFEEALNKRGLSGLQKQRIGQFVAIMLQVILLYTDATDDEAISAHSIIVECLSRMRAMVQPAGRPS